MNRSELVRRVAGETGLGAAESEAAVKGVLAALAGALAQGDEVRFAGFGTFVGKDRPARTARNPRSGVPIAVPARRSRCSTSRSDMPKRDAMAATDWPASVSFAKATTWSAGCMAMRMTFSASEISPGSTSPDLTRQGTGCSASSTPSPTSACMALRRRPPATTA